MIEANSKWSLKNSYLTDLTFDKPIDGMENTSEKLNTMIDQQRQFRDPPNVCTIIKI